MVSSDAISWMSSSRRRAACAYHHTALLRCHEKRWFFIDERNEAHAQSRFNHLEHAGYFQQRCNAAGVIVSPWAPLNRVIVCAEQQYFGLASVPLACGNEICATNPGNIVLQPLDSIVLFALFILNVSDCALESIPDEEVALAYIAGKPLNMFPKMMSEHFIMLHRFPNEFDHSA
jgi:hypothetical protein